MCPPRRQSGAIQESISPLWRALRIEKTLDHAKLEALLESGSDPNEEWDDLALQKLYHGDRWTYEWFPHDNRNVRVSPLFSAIVDNQVGLAEFGLRHGANIDVRTRVGTTALREAVRKRLPEVAKLLIEHGADLEAKVSEGAQNTYAGCTPLQLAVANGSVNMIEILLQGGADLRTASQHGWTAFDIAILDPQAGLIELLLSWCRQQNGMFDFFPHVGLRKTIPSYHHGDGTIAHHLLRNGIEKTDQRHKELYTNGMSTILARDKPSQQVSAETVARDLEAMLTSIAGITGDITWNRNFCGLCDTFQAQESQNMHNTFDHCASIEILHESAGRGCPLCELIAESLNAGTARNGQIRSGSGLYPDEHILCDSPRVRLRVRSYPWMCQSSIQVGCSGKVSAVGLTHVTEQLNLAVCTTIPTDKRGTGSERTLATAKAWFDHCRQEHDRCRDQINYSEYPELPKRVIDVGDELNIPHLLISDGERAPYFALSYCWGQDQNLGTTSSNLTAHVEGIDLESVPKTIRDAILITRKFDIKYIWVDALCIIQDSVEDFEHEAAVMGDIYAHADLTIAVQDSASSSHGCFHERD